MPSFTNWSNTNVTGTIRNFRIAGGLESGSRVSFVYTDSDLHKWADAASRFVHSSQSTLLEAFLNEYIDLVTRRQEPDGYLFTYNQINFPGVRFPRKDSGYTLKTVQTSGLALANATPARCEAHSKLTGSNGNGSKLEKKVLRSHWRVAVTSGGQLRNSIAISPGLAFRR